MEHILNIKNLSHNGIIEAIKNIPTGVTSLDLSRNELGQKRGTILAVAFKLKFLCARRNTPTHRYQTGGNNDKDPDKFILKVCWKECKHS